MTNKEIEIQKALGTLSLCERIKLGETPYKEYKIPMAVGEFNLYYILIVFQYEGIQVSYKQRRGDQARSRAIQHLIDKCNEKGI